MEFRRGMRAKRGLFDLEVRQFPSWCALRSREKNNKSVMRLQKEASDSRVLDGWAILWGRPVVCGE